MNLGITGAFGESVFAASTRGIDAYDATTLLRCDLPGHPDEPLCYDPPVIPAIRPDRGAG